MSIVPLDGLIANEVNDKITVKQYADFCRIYYLEKMNKEIGHNFAHIADQRFGQAFMNTFYAKKVFPSLFYCENDRMAKKMIEHTFVDWQRYE